MYVTTALFPLSNVSLSSLLSQSLVSQSDRSPRACIGKNIALMDLSKFIPESILRFAVSFADPNHDWAVHGDGLVKSNDLLARLTNSKVMP